MKEATGELSMTAIVVVVLGILAVALPMIINQVVKTAERNANCSAAFGCDVSTCGVDEEGNYTGTMTCQYTPDGTAADASVAIKCPCSGQK